MDGAPGTALLQKPALAGGIEHALTPPSLGCAGLAGELDAAAHQDHQRAVYLVDQFAGLEQVGGFVAEARDGQAALPGGIPSAVTLREGLALQLLVDGLQCIDQLASRARGVGVLQLDRGEEVTDSILDSPQSVVFDQAENRMHLQKALLAEMLGGLGISLAGYR